MHRAAGRIIGPDSQPGGERTGTGIGRVDVPAQQHGGDTPGAGQLEGRGGGLSASARYPAVVEQQDTGSDRRSSYKETVSPQIAALLSRADGQRDQRQPQVRRDQPEQRVRARAAEPGRHHSQQVGCFHARTPPCAGAVILQEGKQQDEQSGLGGGARRRRPGLVAPQRGGVVRSLYRVADGHDGVGEQNIELYARKFTPSIRDDGLARVLKGETTIEEVLRVTRED